MDDLDLAWRLRLLVPRSRCTDHGYDMRAHMVMLVVSHYAVCSAKDIGEALDIGVATVNKWRTIAEQAQLVTSWESGRNTHTRVSPRGLRILALLHEETAS